MERRPENGSAQPVLHLLPADSVRVIGRDAEQLSAARLMAKSRLLTLVGISGVGKSVLARRIAAGKARASRDGVRYLDVSTQLPAGDDAVDRVLSEVAEHEVLLVLDNCESAVDEVAGLVARLLRTSSYLRMLATGRQPLRIGGECVLPVRPLAGRADGQEDAVRIFAEHAAIVELETLDPEQRDAVESLCLRLGGVPGAIARAARLIERRMSRSGVRPVLSVDRQATGDLVDAILYGIAQASCGDCDDTEKMLLSRLVAFDGSCSLEQITATCGYGEVRASEIPMVLDRLVDRSLVDRTAAAGQSRFGVPSPLRPYWRSQADAVDLGTVLTRQTAWLHEESARARAALLTAGEDQSLARLRLGWTDTWRLLARNLTQHASAHSASRSLTRIWPYLPAVNRHESVELLRLARTASAADGRVMPGLTACLAQVAVERPDVPLLAGAVGDYCVPRPTRRL